MITNKEYNFFLIHYDEIAIKLGNRCWFEKQLIKNIKNNYLGFIVQI